MPEITVNQAADFFLAQVDEDAGDVMTHLKLQKLLYYAQGWHLALHNKPLFKARIEAWSHGPVCPAIWKRFKKYSFDPIPKSAINSDLRALSKSVFDFLAEVWAVYGQFTASRLEDMTHQEQPWIDARVELSSYEKSSDEITVESMQKFFKQLKHGEKA